MIFLKHPRRVCAFIGVYLSVAMASVYASGVPQHDDHGVILLYHHVSDTTPVSTSISPRGFVEHLDLIEAQGFTVWPLTRLVSALQAGQPIPEHTIAITFDDAYISVYDQAWPELKRRGWPFTVFVNTQAIGDKPSLYMSWSQLQAMAAENVTLGNHSHTHDHLLSQQHAPNWAERVKADIATASQLLEEKVGQTPTLFAYPYGEFNPALKKVVSGQGLIAFGQHSGAVDYRSDFLALPRFPLGGAYASASRLQTILNSRPLNIHSSPQNGLVIEPHTQTLKISLTVDEGNYNLDNLACYAGGNTRVELTRQEPRLFTLTISNVVSSGRHKVNCTVADRNRPSQYYWWSFVMMKKPATLDWYPH